MVSIDYSKHQIFFYQAPTGASMKVLGFKTGRIDCVGTPPTNRPLPSNGITDAVSFLRDQFGLTLKEAVALLGTITPFTHN